MIRYKEMKFRMKLMVNIVEMRVTRMWDRMEEIRIWNSM